MKHKFLITGIKSGLGKYLYNNLPNAVGADRENFNIIKDEEYETIIHCAFNRENIITDYKKYLDDNIFFTQRLQSLNYKNFIYISSVDVYQEYPTTYSLFKQFSESILNNDTLILRCSMILGHTMRSNHITKLKDNIQNLSLSEESEFNYILMDNLVEFFISEDYKLYRGIIDFVSNNSLKLKEVKNYFNSSTILGDYIYKTNLEFPNPIFKLNTKYNNSSFNNLQQFYGKFF